MHNTSYRSLINRIIMRKIKDHGFEGTIQSGKVYIYMPFYNNGVSGHLIKPVTSLKQLYILMGY